jgi:hypothetical protein
VIGVQLQEGNTGEVSILTLQSRLAGVKLMAHESAGLDGQLAGPGITASHWKVKISAAYGWLAVNNCRNREMPESDNSQQCSHLSVS